MLSFPVTHNEIVQPTMVSVGKSFSVSCDADLAGVPDMIYGVRVLNLMWSSGKAEPITVAQMLGTNKQTFSVSALLVLHYSHFDVYMK